MSKTNHVCEEAVFARIYQEHSKAIWNFIYFKCGNMAQADDLVQESFIKLWQNCAKVPQEKARAFLYKVCSNQFLNEVAHQKVVFKYQQQYIEKSNLESPQFVLEQQEFHQKLERAISNLSEIQRTPFLLNRIEGKKYREIAEILDISIKAVEKRMSLALAALRKEIEGI